MFPFRALDLQRREAWEKKEVLCSSENTGQYLETFWGEIFDYHDSGKILLASRR